jgi:ABC-type phosphate/phosphonate transport system permease subunit
MSDLGIGYIVADLFGPLGAIGGVLCILLLFYIDAVIFPTLPELFTVLVFVQGYGLDPILLAALLLLAIAVGEVAGLLTLYEVVRRLRVPARLQRAIMSYRDFLVCQDEKMILINRVAPVLPFMGAFVALCHWDLKRSVLYLLVGGMTKYGLILLLSGFFLAYMEKGTATTVTIIMVLVVIVLSFIATIIRKNRMKNRMCEDANRPA